MTDRVSVPCHLIFLLLLLLLTATPSPSALAQTSPPDRLAIKQAQQKLQGLNQNAAAVNDEQDLQASIEAVRAIQQMARQCIDSGENDLRRLKFAISSDTGGGDGKGPLLTNQQKIQETLVSCRYLLASADEAQEALLKALRRLETRRIFFRDRNSLSLTAATVAEPLVSWRQTVAMAGDTGLLAQGRTLLPSFFFLFLALLLLFSRLRRIVHRHHPTPTLPVEGNEDLERIAGRLPLIGALAVTGAVAFAIRGIYSTSLLFAGIFAFAAMLLTIEAGISAVLAAGRIRVGAILVLLAPSVLILHPFVHGDLLHSLRFLTAASAALFCLLLPIDTTAAGSRQGVALRLLRLAAFIAAAAGLAGYHQIGPFLLRVTIGGLAGWMLVRLANRRLDGLFAGFATGVAPWQERLRLGLGYNVGEVISGLAWLRLLAKGCCWILYGLLLSYFSDTSHTFAAKAADVLARGVSIGETTIVPARIAGGLVLFALLWALAGRLTKRISAELKAGKLNRAGRDTAVTIFRYASFVTALVAGLGVAGFDLGNLAIIAGALSVGLGFGLQNIVNNFVSGLILLFERPIKRGDWIVVGSTEGHVREINVRATVIRTFDNADVVVPNSELISGQVTNWMLSDRAGRVRVPVGVAYGSDTMKVKEILLQEAHAHPMVITGGSMPEPQVLFMEFGDSSLNFELRAFITDINQRLAVSSDLNFAIDAAFRREGVEIPFPQRDLHIKEMPAGQARLQPGPAPISSP